MIGTVPYGCVQRCVLESVRSYSHLEQYARGRLGVKVLYVLSEYRPEVQLTELPRLTVTGPHPEGSLDVSVNV